MGSFNNPFKYEDGLEGFVYTWLYHCISLICSLISVITFTIYTPTWYFPFAAWYTLRGVNKRRTKPK